MGVELRAPEGRLSSVGKGMQTIFVGSNRKYNAVSDIYKPLGGSLKNG